jgi:uncharacterized DUF497 family protein
MRFEWDEEKAHSNYRKHRVLFETATLVFDDPGFIMLPDRDVEGEERWHTLGRAGDALLLLVAHTLQDDEGEEIVRIISAREVTPHERRLYEASQQ